MYSEVVKESAVLRRSAVVNQLYGGWKLAVEAKQLEEQPEAIKTRGDN
jgi:LYR motif-containing protein 4